MTRLNLPPGHVAAALVLENAPGHVAAALVLDNAHDDDRPLLEHAAGAVPT